MRPSCLDKGPPSFFLDRLVKYTRCELQVMNGGDVRQIGYNLGEEFDRQGPEHVGTVSQLRT